MMSGFLSVSPLWFFRWKQTAEKGSEMTSQVALLLCRWGRRRRDCSFSSCCLSTTENTQKMLGPASNPTTRILYSACVLL